MFRDWTLVEDMKNTMVVTDHEADRLASATWEMINELLNAQNALEDTMLRAIDGRLNDNADALLAVVDDLTALDSHSKSGRYLVDRIMAALLLASRIDTMRQTIIASQSARNSMATSENNRHV